jgi:hypothetical protein
MKRIFNLWHNHTIGCCRVLSILLLGAVISETFAQVYACSLLIMWLILKTGYEQGWQDTPTEKGGD